MSVCDSIELFSLMISGKFSAYGFLYIGEYGITVEVIFYKISIISSL